MDNFCCDYLEGCHPRILERLQATNLEQTAGYGLDPYCEEAAEHIRRVFHCPKAAVHFLMGGTQANTTVIASMLRPWEGVLCAETGHINVHETGAIESTGHKVLALPAKEGRITGAQVSVATALQGDNEHVVKPGMVYISMSTELGTVYNLAELTDLRRVTEENGLAFFIDGARLGYALTSPFCDVKPADLAGLCDVFTVGGTKVGALFGEAVVINDPGVDRHFRYMIKQRGGMLAKGRLLGLQFSALMEDELYFRIAHEAVLKAMRIRDRLVERDIPLLVDSPTNQIFPIFTDEQLEALEEDFMVETWERVDENRTCVRICTSWATTEAMVDRLLAALDRLG